MKQITWIIMANSVDAHVYSVENPSYTLLETLSHPKGRLKSGDLVSDRQGHYQTDHTSRGQFSATTDPHKKEQLEFAKMIADYLESARREKRFDSLIFCAEPHFYGLFEKEVAPHVHSLIKKTIEKDYIPLSKEKRDSVIEALIADKDHFK